jgi:hypothetical protein
MVRAARLDRRFFTELIFDDYATGNAVIVVALVYALIALTIAVGRPLQLSMIGLLKLVLGGLVGWLILGGALWVVGVKLFNGRGRGQTILRLIGFAHAPLVVSAVGLLLLTPVDTAIVVVGFVWFFAAVVSATKVLFDFDFSHAVSATLLAFAVWWAASLIGLGLDLTAILGLG